MEHCWEVMCLRLEGGTSRKFFAELVLGLGRLCLERGNSHKFLKLPFRSSCVIAFVFCHDCFPVVALRIPEWRGKLWECGSASLRFFPPGGDSHSIID